jgi:hypothetical protein
MSCGGCALIHEKTVARAAEGRPSGQKDWSEGVCVLPSSGQHSRGMKIPDFSVQNACYPQVGTHSPPQVTPTHTENRTHSMKITPTAWKLHPHTVKITPTASKFHPHTVKITPTAWKLHPQPENYTHLVKNTPTPLCTHTLRNVKNQCFSSYPVAFHPLDTLLFNVLFIFNKMYPMTFDQNSIFLTFLILINIFSHTHTPLNRRPYHFRQLISAFLHKWRHPYWNRPIWYFFDRKRENSIKMYIYIE